MLVKAKSKFLANTWSGTHGIPRQSLTSAVADKLREMIIRGEIQEGEQLRQDGLADEFQVSRIPIREALRQLEAEGLIKIIAHHGAIVSSLSSDEIGELFDIRALLECDVLRLSIPHLKEEDFKKAEAILDVFDKALWTESEVGSWGRLNYQFHSTLYSRANRPRFMSIIQGLNNNGDRYTRLHLYLSRSFEQVRTEHRALLDFCRKRDLEAACDLLRCHIQSAGTTLKEAVQQRREKTA
jgi:DNA-binding GntR family transcriptional regulator